MRKQNWPVILEEYIQSHESSEFVWGANDCVLFSANCANALLEESLDEEIASYGQYDEAGAAQIIEQKGSMSAIMDAHFERYPSVAQAKRGDIVLVRIESGKAFGVVDGTGRRVACKTVDGLIFVPLLKGLRAWAVI